MLGQSLAEAENRQGRRQAPGFGNDGTVTDIEVVVLRLEVVIHDITELDGSAWVCRKSCWSTKRGLCKGCAPDLGVEMISTLSDPSLFAWIEAPRLIFG